MLVVDKVKKKYGDFTAVNQLSFYVKPGEVFGLLGTNGAGKTTTFKMIMGLLEPTEGEISFNGRRITYDDVDKIGYMIEERSLLPRLKVKELIVHYGRLKNLSEETIMLRTRYWLERFNISDYEDKKINTLSKGNQQKIQFITSIINNPELLILDEPFSGMDPLNTQKFVDVIEDFRKKGTVIIFSTHQIDHIESFCEKLLILEKGEAILEGRIDAIKKEYKKHSILIVAEQLDEKVLRSLPGVYDVIIEANQWVVKIEDESYAQDVFSYVKTLKNVRKFDVEQAKLSEIFIDKVGDAYEEV